MTFHVKNVIVKFLPCQQKVEKIQKHMQKYKVSIYSIYTAVPDRRGCKN